MNYENTIYKLYFCVFNFAEFVKNSNDLRIKYEPVRE
jgi:hypothetical protein